MKRAALILVLCLTALALTACGGRNMENTSVDTRTSRLASVASAQAESAAAEAALPAGEAAIAASQAEGCAPAEDADRPVDLDLTAISGTVVYSQVYDMLMEPEVYVGQKIRLKGGFSYYQDPDTMQEYYAAVIADATACCAQGVEFVWKGEHSYPKDYPPLDTNITVTGIFDTYYEEDNLYVRLTDAEVNW